VLGKKQYRKIRAESLDGIVQIGHRLSLDGGVIHGKSLKRQDSKYPEISIPINNRHDDIETKVKS
jgi:hypothetical protein